MDLKQRRISEALTKSSFSVSDPSRNLNPDRPFTQFDPTNLCYGARTEQPFPGFSPPFDTPSLHSYHPEHEAKKVNQSEPTPICNNTVLDWDPRAMLSNLSFLEQKIHQVQDIVRSIISRQGQCSNRSNELAAQQQLVTADLTCIIIQLISTAGTLLPSVKNTILSTSPSARQLESIIGSPTSFGLNGTLQQDEGLSSEGAKPSEYDELIKGLNDCGGEGNESIPIEEHDVKDSEDGVDGENLPPGSYEVLQLEKEEILAPHTHFCLICGKGFKRDANLRMHMRGHGDEYKTPAALAKPSKDLNSEPVLIKRYSCPFVGCKRNKDHKKFQPLKTILCVKNHYKRTHCDKSYTCSRCNSKKFSVIADLKTHEKHCGRHKWLCSCGTTFSRKDKLFGHVALFQGHTPALPMDEVKSSGTSSDQGQNNGAMAGTGIMGYNFPGSTAADDIMDTKGVNDDRGGYFSPMNFDSCNFGGLDDFPQPAFEVSENSFSFIHSGSYTFARRNGENSSSNRLR